MDSSAIKAGDCTFLTGALVDDGDSTNLGETQMEMNVTVDDHERGAYRISALNTASTTFYRTPEAEAFSARKQELIREAQLRAEHQANARLTMLTLAEALDEASLRQRELERKLYEEQQTSASLNKQLGEFQPTLDKALAEVELWRFKTLCKELESSLKERPFLPFSLWWAWEVRPIREERSYAGSQLTSAEKKEVDRITLKWLFKAWKDMSHGGSERKKLEATHRSALDVLKTKAATELAEQVALTTAEKKISRELANKMQAKQEEVLAAERRVSSLETEKGDILRKTESLVSKHRIELETLRAELDEALAQLKKKEAEYATLNQALHNAEETLILAKAQSEEEKKSLKAKLSDMSAELQQSIFLAKYMREAASKAKRDAAGCISPEKFAQLIEELEEMRDKLIRLGHEKDMEKEQNTKLKGKLQQNQRRLELERQFLPLLHKVRGPVGPANAVLQKKESLLEKKTVLAPLDASPVANTSPDRMRNSRSMGALDGYSQVQNHNSSMSSSSNISGYRGGGGPLLGGL